MSFASVLDAYCNALGCTNKRIAEECGISPSALSRYRNGERSPELGGDAISGLIKGISRLSRECLGDGRWQEGVVREALEGSLAGSKFLGMSFGMRIDALMDLLKLRNAEVAQTVGVSLSYVSRIRSGQRMPANRLRFAHRISQLAAMRCVEFGKTGELLALVDSVGETADRQYLDLDSIVDLSEVVELWLLGNNIVESDLAAVENLFGKLNAFYFTEVLDRIGNLPPVETAADGESPFARFCYGPKGMREAALTFFETTAGRNASTLFLSSDIPLAEIMADTALVGMYNSMVDQVIARGGHVAVVHGIERPLAETIASLEHWLPLYLTGQATPYYLKGFNNRVFYHANYVSDACAFSAEAVMGHQSSGRCYLSTLPEDLAYYRHKMDCVVERASPMLEVHFADEFESHGQMVEAAMAHARQVEGHAVGVGRYEHLRITSFPGQCAVVTILCDPAIHVVIRYPKLRYVISHMR